MLRIYALLFASLCLLLSCQSAKVGNPTSPNYPPPAGSVIILNQDLEIPPETTRVFLQQGKVYGYHGFDRYLPWCYFELEKLKSTTQILSADTFEIYRITSRTEQVVENTAVHLAGLGVRPATDTLVAMSGGDGPSTETAVVHMWLRSERQSDIRKLVCGGAEENPAIVQAPSIDQIRTSLGEIATLQLLE